MDIEKVKEITSGATDIRCEDNYFAFLRFTEAEKNSYKNEPDMLIKTCATAGIKMDFITDGDSISFSYRFIRASSRTLAFFDVYVNESFFQTVGKNCADSVFDGEYRLDLPNGQNRITICFPNLYALRIKDFNITNYEILKPVPYDHTIISYGDSITQGYDAMLPSYSYMNRTARQLNAKLYNKAIGGDMFRPELLNTDDVFDADIVTVAYGTNDWTNRKKEEVLKNTALFFEYLENKYYKSKIFIITPIWRKDCNNEVPFGRFEEMRNYLTNEAGRHKSFTVADGDKLFPKNDLLFSDGYLHPNDMGMNIYAENLTLFIKNEMRI